MYLFCFRVYCWAIIKPIIYLTTCQSINAEGVVFINGVMQH
ncbi:hypothetical protein DJ013_13200 [Arcticibacterium luteifluviistationis]|uniref:Uncharacterized protein n=1 Tax=Arcticibacterium luteifluviistationis TaxID=1784714 RepID=A0A2Z4GIN8_9BACT|nr:hypothetical protein DJ013_13200 [Arcticibacterium luteifluviistationis]